MIVVCCQLEISETGRSLIATVVSLCVIQKLQELGSPGPRWAVPQKKMTGLNYRTLEENKRVEVGGGGVIHKNKSNNVCKSKEYSVDQNYYNNCLIKTRRPVAQIT